MRLSVWIIGILLVIGLPGCEQRGPSDVIEEYLQARVASDVTQLRSLACTDWEAQAAIEAESFRSMNAVLENMTCQQNGEQDGFTVVTCEGKMTTTYNGETREWPLGAYRLRQEDGEWRMCGEADVP
jgi:hypothetical protein